MLDRNRDDNPGERGLGEKRLEELENQQAQNNALNTLPRLLGPNFTWSLAFVVILLFVALALLAAQWRWQKHLQPLAPGAQAVQEMYRFVRFIGLAERADATPDERAELLATRMPESREAISQVNALYVRERYGAYPLTESESADARVMGIGVQKQMWRTAYAHHSGRRLDAAREWFKTLMRQARDKIERVKTRVASRE